MSTCKSIHQIPLPRSLLARLLAARLFPICMLMGFILPSSAHGWGAMHGAITQSALSVLPAWQQELLGEEKTPLINTYCMIPDLAQAPAYKKEFTRLVVLPNGDLFCHLPFKTRDRNAYQIRYYVERTVETLRHHEVAEAAHWAGCLLHFLEDSGSPAHTMPGDNQMGLLKDLMPTPDAFQNQALHGLIEEGKLFIKLGSYRPQLLGTTTEEAVSNLMERYNAMVRNARAQVIPILEGTYKQSQEEINAGQLRAATMDAQVVADALYTIFCIAGERFDPEETAQLETVALSALTPMEVIHQSYFPQHTYFSDPYFGFPVRNGILDANKVQQALMLNVAKGGKAEAREFKRGLGLGTNSRVTYALPNNVYEQFECLVGLHAALGGAGKVIFRVLADGKAVFESPVIEGNSPALAVSVPIWGVKELVLVMEGRSKERGHNFAVIGDALLHKTKDSVKLKESKEETGMNSSHPSEEQLRSPNRIPTE